MPRLVLPALVLCGLFAVTPYIAGEILRAADNPVARLGAQLEAGAATFEGNSDAFGILPPLLRRLGIQADSQVLVFSKTSLQTEFISPRHPRAIYFNDDVYVAFVQDSNVLELATVDAIQGPAFYTMEARQGAGVRLELRTYECSSCHGMMPRANLNIQSVVPTAEGVPFDLLSGVQPPIITHRTPFEDRWGGWYVTGTHGTMRHRGNAVAADPARPFDLEQEGTQNITRLDEKLDTTAYLAPTSDLVALMTLEHQVHMHNLLARTARHARAAAESEWTNAAARKIFDAGVEELIAYMLFTDEAPLREAVRGVSTFSATFGQRGPFDRRGRSLREFDLSTRLFRYPLTYMIYSEQFQSLPARATDAIYQRLFYRLRTGVGMPSLSPDDRRAIVGIVRETKEGLPDYWVTDNW
jgi:hypothetical protein